MKKSVFFLGTIILTILMLTLSSCTKNIPEKRENTIQNSENKIVVNISANDIEEINIIEKKEANCDDSCKKQNALNLSDYLLCSNIENLKTKNECFYEIGIIKKSKDSCGKISDLSLRNQCYDKIGYVGYKIEVKKNVQAISTFQKTSNELCEEDGVPVVRMYGASWCSHCKWAFPIFMKVAKEYQNKGLIKAYAWEINTGDNLITEELEFAMPKEEIDFYNQNNPKGMVPYFNFGCQYTRIGTGYELGNGTRSEENEYRLVIDKLIVNLIKN